MLVLITTTGRVEQRVVDCPVRRWARTRSVTCGRGSTRGRRAAAWRTYPRPLADLPAAFAPEDRPAVAALLATLLETLVEEREERIVLGGTANLTRFGMDFPGMRRARPRGARGADGAAAAARRGVTDPSQVTVRIGHENSVEGLQHDVGGVASATAAATHAVANLGVLGPTRMDYPGTMGAVRAVARYVGRILAEA